MLNACERRLIAFYLANAASRLHHQDREASELAAWIADRDNRVAFGTGRRQPRLRHPDPDPEEGMSRGKLLRLEAALREEYAKVRRARHDRTARRLRALGQTVGLHRTDLDILELLLRYRTQPVIESMVDDIFGRAARSITPFNLKERALPALLGMSAHAIHGRFAGRRAARALGARLGGQRRRPECGRSAESARHGAGRHVPGREPPVVPGPRPRASSGGRTSTTSPATATMSSKC